MSSSPDLSIANQTAEDASVASSSSSSSTSSSNQQRESQKMREMTVLPKDFEPSETDVVIGRGKRARTHAGNQRLRGLIEFMIPEYSAAGSNKDEKSYIIKEIVTQIRKSSPDGGFVKFDKVANRWCEVGDFLAREKVSQTFRDAMGDAYSSSNPYKRKRRSFEKKHNAIMDIIKRRRGSSPTSVLQSGASTPPSPSSPEPAGGEKTKKLPLAVTAPPSPPVSPPQPSPVLMDNMAMFNKRPGQIGFARRSMLHFGLPATVLPPTVARSASLPPHHPHPMSLTAVAANALRMRPVPGMVPLRRPVPHFSGSMSSMPSRRVSMPSTAGPVPSYNSAMLSAADMMNRQRLAARDAALIRRSSTGP